MTEGGIVGEFLGLKEETDADLLAMQCGDFYEFFADDAELVAEELDLRVSEKSSHGSSYPMAGVPLSELTPYLKALVERGYRVAVAEQYDTEDGHAREIVRVATPGTLIETAAEDARYLAGIVRVAEDCYGLAFAEVTTGRFLVTRIEGEDAAARAITECYRYDPVEILPGPDLREDEAFLSSLAERTDAEVTRHEANAFAPGAATHTTREQFGRETLSSLGLEPEGPAVRAAGAVLSYVAETGLGVLPSMTRLQPYGADDFASCDVTTQRNLEITETMTGAGQSLFATVDHTVTSAGGRLLKEWLGRPRRSLGELRRRQECVTALSERALAREDLREILGEASDLERLASRTTHGSADAGALLRARDSLALVPELADLIAGDDRLADSPLSKVVERPDREATVDLREALDEGLANDPPKTLREGGLIERGYDANLDELVERHEEALEWIEELGPREKDAHGFAHLQVDRNKTDGYYIQIGKSEAEDVPDSYRQVKTLKNSVRFSTDALEEREREILRLEEQRGELEYDLFCELRERVAKRATLLQDVGRAIAELDALASFATHAVENRWRRPELEESRALDIEAGRHPVVEQSTEFVPNDLSLTDEREFLIVTGPNMSGKSTYMRQVALIVLLAQVGSFVPAERARVGLVDGIYTRVGALDELAQGRSTFMVEMSELSNILHSATEDSLVILDEVGRGTATYDGISIAWATTEYLHNEVRAKTLFATHYHELTALAEHLPRVENVHVAVDDSGDGVTFLRTIREGPTDRSYGVHVAELAGVPGPVVSRSDEVLERLRAEKAIEAKGGGGDRKSSGESGTQQVVFDVGSGEMRTASADGGNDPGPEPDGEDPLDPETEAVLTELSELELASLSPVELMGRVQEWQGWIDE
ncbi:DNA mismatch repair protein MutS [Halalkalicoccus jeotgali]|uniref:DNA mismatch repair protein MutS n=1 Tax=Halalkalicoccus jeotgali (strain DSM 18796 / CECT 7217 / JCM 14584 / KCTC 4019 / B3) TaxID=795797 RepID=D8J8L1_HALJB|nr:DNA mismatch repair protein MutS [Halalkalicoccus jeotgali]ADJ16257.1 DNA mismatch repair protein MutS [Halalkalicoccus jeotgali B3]ELY36992.1 DNA mismatch repair protein MutS [Halalkalicoccus jeotgali B3]